MLRFSKWSFIVTIKFFLLIIMAVRNVKQTIMKDYNIQFCQWMTCDCFCQPTRDHNVDYVKKIFYNLLWLAEYQCKGMVKFKMSHFFFWGQFQHTLRGEWGRGVGFWKQTRANKGKGEGVVPKLGNLEQIYFLNILFQPWATGLREAASEGPTLLHHRFWFDCLSNNSK